MRELRAWLRGRTWIVDIPPPSRVPLSRRLPVRIAVALGVFALGVLACEPPSAGEEPPVDEPAEIVFADVSVGDLTACALDADGVAYCWGRYAANDTALPVAVATDQRFRSLAVGRTTRCALTEAGAAWCWGNANGGQLGNGEASGTAWEPVEVAGGHSFVALARGNADHRCAIRADQTAWCWGWNGAGQLGHGLPADYEPVPVQVGLSSVSERPTLLREAAVSPEHACGLTSAGTAVCWGANDYGQLGDGTTTPRAGPLPVTPGLTFTTIVTGGIQPGRGFTCALDAEGRAYCWGTNAAGSLGDGTTDDRLVPTAVATTARFVRIAAGGLSVCALTADGDAFCWGQGLAAGAPELSARVLVPTLISGGHRFTRIATGNNGTCAVTTDADSYCWGVGTGGRLGNGRRDLHTPEPQKVGGR